MNNILMIMNARDIPECINSLKLLKIDKVWFRGYTERELEKVIDTFIQTTNYDRYILVSDDVIATQEALDTILEFSKYIKEDEVITGWCDISPNIKRANVQLTEPNYQELYKLFLTSPHFITTIIKKTRWISELVGVKSLYAHFALKAFPKSEEIKNQTKIFRTYFIGWVFTSISRKTWIKYPFSYPRPHENTTGSDMNMSNTLMKENVVMYCVRDSYIIHLHSMKNFIVGKVKKEIIFERMN